MIKSVRNHAQLRNIVRTSGVAESDKKKNLYTFTKKLLLWAIFIGIGAVIFEILKENFPFGLFILSIVLTGSVIRGVLKGYSFKDRWNVLDAWSIAFGLTINIITLWLGYNIKSFGDFSIYVSFDMWLKLVLFTGLFAFIAWRYTTHGFRWIQDNLIKVGLVVAGILLLAQVINSIPTLFDTKELFACNGRICVLKVVFGKVLYLIGQAFVIYIVTVCFKVASKKQRYPKRVKDE